MIPKKRAVSYQPSAFSFAFQTFLTTRRITCRVGACGSKTARKLLMHLWLTADRWRLTALSRMMDTACG